MPQLNAARPIVYENGTMQPEMRDQMNALYRNLPIVGTGSPEGVVEAPQFSLYIRSDGASGTIEYRKMQTDIAGDRKLGWVAV